MFADVIVLAGGRSSRLGGVAKASLVRDERTLLEHAIAAARPAGGRIIVVGPEDRDSVSPDSISAAVRFTRERPAFGGPAAAIAAGLDALREADGVTAEFVVVLACDMPFASAALAAVLDAADRADHAAHRAATTPDERRVDGWVALDETGRTQQLLAVYRVASLEGQIASLRDARQWHDLAGLAVRHLVAGLELQPVTVPPGGAADVDTWEDAERLGVVVADEPGSTRTPGAASAPGTTLPGASNEGST